MNPENNTDTIRIKDAELSDILRFLYHKLVILIIAGILGGTFTYLGIRFLVKPTYQSTVSFYIYSYPDDKARTDTVSSSDLAAAEKLTTTYASIMGSNSVLDAVIRHMDAPETLTRGSLSQMIRTSIITNTQLLAVTVTTKDAELSYRIAASFAEVVPDEIIRITKVGSVELVDRPEIAVHPASPDIRRDSCIGIVCALLLTAAVLVLRMLSDTTIYLSDDILQMTDTPILGQIPNIDEDRNMKSWEKVSGGIIKYVRKEEA